MSSDDDLKEFETRLQTLGVDSNLLQTVRDATLSFDHKSDGTPLRPSLHTLPELRLDRDSIEEQAPDLFVIETLGEGGMGVVRLANQMSLDREVAVKTLREDKGEEVAQALLEEAYITGYLEHPNIIPIYTVGRSESGAPLIVMKRIEGTSWRERLLAHDQWPPEDLSAEIEILIQVANAARFAHSRGVIHRDIKTENVMIGDFDEVYLLDWGVAISLDDSKALLPQPKDETGLSGTPGFLAPEMALQYTDVIDERTDVYLLGATLHEILTGQPRHKGSTLLQILYAANQSEPYDYGDQVPEELARIANCACHRDHRQRFPSAEAFRQALEDFLRHRESNAISSSADEKRRELETHLEADEPNERSLHDTYGECRFGYEQALRMWPDNTDASRGLQQCLESMLEYNLEQKNLDACRACLADLPENKSVWRERVDALAKEIEEDQQDLERLKKMEDDLDLHTASSARSLLMLLFGIIWTGTSLYGALRYGGEQTSNADQLRSHMHSGLRNFAIAAGGLFAFRKRVFANVANARLAYLLLAFTATLAMIRWSTWYLEEHILTSRLAENGLAILLLIAIGLVSDLRICLFALIYVVLGAATLLWPEYYPFSRPVAIALTFGGFAWLWSPSQLDKKISL